jgi:hypothetical protein
VHAAVATEDGERDQAGERDEREPRERVEPAEALGGKRHRQREGDDRVEAVRGPEQAPRERRQREHGRREEGTGNVALADGLDEPAERAERGERPVPDALRVDEREPVPDPRLEGERVGQEHREWDDEQTEVTHAPARTPRADRERRQERNTLRSGEEREPRRDRGPADAAAFGEEERPDCEREEQ